MKNNLDIVKNILHENKGYTLVLADGNNVFTSDEIGIKPLLKYMGEIPDLKNYSAADKIIGRAAAFLYIYSGIKYVYGEVMSAGAISLFTENDIEFEYGEKTDKIINRMGTDICPMDKAVSEITDYKIAYEALKNKVTQMQNLGHGK